MSYDKDDKRTHLELIQNVVTRMASNSFAIKGWTITLVAALMALSAASGTAKLFFFIAYVPLLAFWILDGYFLSLEKIYRKIYDYVAKDKITNEEYFSLNMTLYISRYNQIENNKYSGFKHVVDACITKTIFPFYIGLTVLVSVVFTLAL
ncbi:hypothetical protein [Moritella sp. 28]|uniref:hypothetical protein n=1 Tax=Moritella sp. 28 TaxID=2746232 RepID=UPI001BABA4C1|nr:hypothetical protein [Moritella sp. 28]QUM86157.1 hypothetical protein HWV02_17395 [Moritella sp. 28]